jgi:hypothetical protein
MDMLLILMYFHVFIWCRRVYGCFLEFAASSVSCGRLTNDTFFGKCTAVQCRKS